VAAGYGAAHPSASAAIEKVRLHEMCVLFLNSFLRAILFFVQYIFISGFFQDAGLFDGP